MIQPCDLLQVNRIGMPGVFPRNLIACLPRHLPLAFVSIPRLSTSSLEDWLRKYKIPYSPTTQRRPLHGALVARSGHGLIFLDSTDDPSNQQFSAAHEAAHFISDHLIPRHMATRVLGTSILPVLDGERPPTPEEALSAVINRIPLEAHIHLMTRAADGAITSWAIEEREQDADRFALELMAPLEDVASRLLAASNGCLSDVDALLASEILVADFGLPSRVATQYAGELKRRFRPTQKFSSTLLGANDEST